MTKDSKRLCIDARMYRSSGIGTYLSSLLPYLCNQFAVTLLGDEEELQDYRGIADIIPFTTPIYSISEQRQFKKVVPTTDLFWSPHFNVPLFSVRATKRVVTIHDVFHLAHYKELNVKQKIYAKVVINRAIKVSDLVVTVSEFSKTELEKYTKASPNQIQVIHNGVRQERRVLDFEVIREKYQLPSHYILFVGNVKPHKNLKTLLLAYLQLAEEIQIQYKIVIVGKIDGFITGDPELMTWIKEVPLLQDNIRFTGFVEESDMDTLYAYASLFVLPSLYEGFGLPPLEAMLNNCPVLASDIPSLQEVCGNAATYFDPYNPQDLAVQISKILNNTLLIPDFVTKGLQRIKLFQWKSAAERHIQIFNQLINEQ
jgi:glycosyltransferase involved in cell wall biosynthesis